MAEIGEPYRTERSIKRLAGSRTLYSLTNPPAKSRHIGTIKRKSHSIHGHEKMSEHSEREEAQEEEGERKTSSLRSAADDAALPLLCKVGRFHVDRSQRRHGVGVDVIAVASLT